MVYKCDKAATRSYPKDIPGTWQPISSSPTSVRGGSVVVAVESLEVMALNVAIQFPYLYRIPQV